MAKMLVIAAVVAAVGILCWSLVYSVGLYRAPHVYTTTVATALEAEVDDVFLRSGCSLLHGRMVNEPVDRLNGRAVIEWDDGSREETTLNDGKKDGPSLLYDKEDGRVIARFQSWFNEHAGL